MRRTRRKRAAADFEFYVIRRKSDGYYHGAAQASFQRSLSKVFKDEKAAKKALVVLTGSSHRIGRSEYLKKRALVTLFDYPVACLGYNPVACLGYNPVACLGYNGESYLTPEQAKFADAWMKTMSDSERLTHILEKVEVLKVTPQTTIIKYQ